MSTRFEWLDANHPFLSIQGNVTGTQIGEDEVTAEGAIAISGDEVLVIEGSLEDLRKIADRFGRVVDALEKYYADKAERTKEKQ